MKDHIEQVGRLILEDSEGLCEVVSDINNNSFMIMSPTTKAKYIVSFSIEEIS